MSPENPYRGRGFNPELLKSKVVHPVEKQRAFLGITFPFAANAWENLFPGEDDTGIDRPFLRLEKIGLNAVTTELDAFYQAGIKQPLHDP